MPNRRFVPPLFSAFLLFYSAISLTMSPSVLATSPTGDSEVITTHAIAMHGTPKYSKDFERFEYTSPKATKGGRIRTHSLGTFDSLNAFVAKGNPARKLYLTYDTLTVSSADEPFTHYGLIAETIEYPIDRSWVIYHLNPKAQFHDGIPITAEDVKFTFELLTNKGNPFYGFYYADVTSIEVLSERSIKFNFKENSSQETLLIMGQLPVLPKHYWQGREFAASTLEVPLGSGPYKIAAVNPGRQIEYRRVDDYWAKDHPTRRGAYNFDSLIVDYYRDNVVALEAFKSGEYDYRRENTSKLWATAYSGDALSSGKIIKEEVKHQNPSGMQAFVFNVRRPIFKDIELRKAINLAFDFEWTNKNLFYGAYRRTESFFSNSDLASSGLPSKGELELLTPLKQHLPTSVFNEVYKAPSSAGDKKNRKNLRAAKKLLDQAGYTISAGKLHAPSGEPVKFEILLHQPTFERISNPFVKNLERLGIEVDLRIVDISQYINRIRSFDYDMTSLVITQSLSPGNEQRDFWHSSSANVEGSRNRIGVSNPAIDALVQHVIDAKTRSQLVTATRALDRALLHLNLVVPQWHTRVHRLAYWNRFEHPETAPTYDIDHSIGMLTWWANKDSNQAN